MAITKYLLVLATVCFSFQSFSWGPTGHRVVGEIAQRQLSDLALQKVKIILDNDGLAKVANWPDEIKSDPDNYRHTFSWHYMTWPLGQDEYEYHGEGELVEAIEKNYQVLRKEDASKDDKAKALKFLVHLVGDLHQPLHVGNGQDMGGNTCQVIFHGERTSLHALWDEKLINFTKLSYSEYVEFLMAQKPEVSLSEVKENILIWARESRELREKVYPDEVTKPKNLKSVILSKDYCRRDIDHMDSELPKLGYKYSYQFSKALDRRLLLAGIRLGAMIERAFE